MKKVTTLAMVLFLLSLMAFAQNNKLLSIGQQNLQRRNEQMIGHLQTLGIAYIRSNNTEDMKDISDKIDREIDHWYVDNMQVIMQEKQNQAIKDHKEMANIFSEENIIKEKQQLANEIKAGKIPELMLKTVSPKFAEQIKQRAEMQTKKQNEQQKGKRKPAKV